MKLKIYIYHKQFFFKKMKAVKEKKNRERRNEGEELPN